MQGFKVGWFLVWAILPSGGRGHQSRLSGGTKACVCSRGVFCFNSYIYLFILILFFSCLFPKPPPTFIKNSVGFSKVPDCIKQHQKRHRKYLQTKCEIKSEHSLWRKTLYVHVCLFLLRYFFLGGGGWGMFIPLLAILCWTQLLKNALL